MRDLVLTGIPRSGTTLCCHLLSQCISTVALFEPMPVLTLPSDVPSAVETVKAYFASVRQQISATGTAPSKHRQGRVPDNPFSEPDEDGKRTLVASEGSIRVALSAGAPFNLVIKHNAAFAALLPALADSFPTYAVVRNPLAVLTSWNSVDLPVRNGHVPAAERLDPVLSERLHGIRSRLDRQVAVLDWFCARYTRLEASRVLRYEDIVGSHGDALYSATGCRPDRIAPLANRNLSRLAGGPSPRVLEKALRRGAGAWAHWYSDADLQAHIDALDP